MRASENQQKMAEIRLIALNAERNYVYKLMEECEWDEDIFNAFERSFDYREEALLTNARQDTIFFMRKIMRRSKHFYGNKFRRKDSQRKSLELVKDIQLKAFEKAIEALEEYRESDESAKFTHKVILDYKGMINRFNGGIVKYSEEDLEQKEELRIKAMDLERCEIRKMYESGEITREQSKELRRYINYIESVILYKHVE
ncbi:Sodium, potassium, lithium and rubidium/H(+) antiporter [compost metagenome]